MPSTFSSDNPFLELTGCPGYMLSYLSKFVAYPTHKQDLSHPRLIKFPQKTHNFEVKVNRTSGRHRRMVERGREREVFADADDDIVASQFEPWLYLVAENIYINIWKIPF